MAVLVYGRFLREERLINIDAQLRNTASALLDSELGTLRQIDFDRIEEILSEELGEDRIGKLFVIRNQKGEILFESTSAKLLPVMEIPRAPIWLTLSVKGKYVRILNLQLPRIPDRTLQVGLVLDDHLIYPPYWSRPSYILMAFAFVVGIVATLFLRLILMHPMNELSKFVTATTQKLSSSNEIPSLPKTIFPHYFFGKVALRSKDEFLLLLEGLDTLISKINKNYQITKIGTYQMAHEVKTPLTILRIEIEEAQSKKQISTNLADNLRKELDKVSELVSAFLSWAELENSNRVKNLYANHISKIVSEVITRLSINYPGQIQLVSSEDFFVISAPQHLELILQNLILNALIYSGRRSQVLIHFWKHKIEIQDHGQGIPQSVIDNLGTPFNRGLSEKEKHNGNGLGLAWVTSVCKLYNWKLNIQTGQRGTKVSIIFPEETST